MYIVCADLEGVFVPEIWIEFAQRTQIPELRLTTRDIPDYDRLMERRLAILMEKGLKLKDIQETIAGMQPLAGAVEFLDWLRARLQVVIISDTFVEFARPLMEKLKWPMLLCHSLAVAQDGTISGYRLRQRDGKKRALLAFRSLNYGIIAVGDSYNDVDMLLSADRGILFKPPQNVVDEFPQLPVAEDYEALKGIIRRTIGDTV